MIFLSLEIRKKSTLFLTLFILQISCFSQVADSTKAHIEGLQKNAKELAYLNPAKALELAEESYILSHNAGLKKEELNSYYCFGLIYYYKGFYSLSTDYYRKIAYSADADAEQKSAAWNNMGINFEILNLLDSSLHAYQESMKIDKFLGNLTSEHMVLINTGLLNSKLGRYKEAFKQTLQAKEYFLTQNDQSNIALCYLNIGLFYNEIKQLDSCLINYQRAAEIYAEIKDYPNLILTQINLTDVWIELKNPSKAWDSFRGAKKSLTYIESPYHDASVNGIASSIYRFAGKRDSAIIYSKRAIEGFEEIGTPERVKSEYYALSHLYVETGNIEGFKYSIQKYDSINAAVNVDNLNRRLAEMEIKYELEQINEEVEDAQKQLSIRQTQSIIVTIISVFLLLALIGTYSLYSKVKVANKMLYQKNIELMSNPQPISVQPKKEGVEQSKREENTLLVKFQQVLIDNELYKKPDLSLKMAAQELGTNEKYLSQAINEGGVDNFNTFVNRFRVQEAQKIIIEGSTKDLSIEELGFMVGFTNRHTFSRVFSQLAGITPSEFKRIHFSTLGSKN
jgi:AraC-like DNA-binding protein